MGGVVGHQPPGMLRCCLARASSAPITPGTSAQSTHLTVAQPPMQVNTQTASPETNRDGQSNFCLELVACSASSELSCTGTVTGHEASVNLRVPKGPSASSWSLNPWRCRGSAVVHGPSCLGRQHPGTSLAPLLHLRSECHLGSLQGLKGTGSRALLSLLHAVFSGCHLSAPVCVYF